MLSATEVTADESVCTHLHLPFHKGLIAMVAEVVMAVSYFKAYLYSKKLKLRTDHTSLI